MHKKPHIILVDDHLLFRQGLKSILTIENIADVIGEAANGIEFIDLLSQLEPELAILDIDMPRMNGFEATQKALKLRPDLKIIVYTMFGEEEYYHKMVASGAKGFILKSGGIDELERAISEVMKGNNYFPNFPSLKEKKIINRDKNKTHTDLDLFLISEVPNQHQTIKI